MRGEGCGIRKFWCISILLRANPWCDTRVFALLVVTDQNFFEYAGVSIYASHVT